MRVQQQGKPSAVRSASQQTPRAAAQQAPARPAGWKPVTQSPAQQARALAQLFKTPEGSKQAAKIIQTVAKKNDFAKALNWEAGHIKSVKPLGEGQFDVSVQLDVLKPNGKIEKNYFGAIVNAQGKVLDVPQG